MKKTITSVLVACLSVTCAFSSEQSTQKDFPKMKIELKPLPFAPTALEPYIDADTVILHHDKHQATYVNNLNAILEKNPEIKFCGCLCKLLKNLDSLPVDVRTPIRNNGGGVFNHEFYWDSLSSEKSTPSPELLKAIEKEFGSLENLQTEITQKALAVFGSGYLWLCSDKNGDLKIVGAANQDNPFSVPDKNKPDLIPIFCVDVWEHSYYLKYRNLRAEYLKNIWNIINWQKISERYKKATCKTSCQ